MGRKLKKAAGGSQTNVPHKEAFQRMSYLLQASMAALSATPGDPSLARFYIHTLRTIGKRLVLKMDPSVKRMLCKSCDSLLVAGVTCTHRLKSARSKHVTVRCLGCGALKRFLTDNDYVVWSERAENLVPVTTAGGQTKTEPAPQLERTAQTEGVAS